MHVRAGGAGRGMEWKREGDEEGESEPGLDRANLCTYIHVCVYTDVYNTYTPFPRRRCMRACAGVARGRNWGRWMPLGDVSVALIVSCAETGLVIAKERRATSE